MTQVELGQKIHMFLRFHDSLAAVVKDSRAWRQVQRGREHNLTLYEAELTSLGLEPSPLLEEHPAYLAFREAAVQNRYVDPDKNNLVELGECRAVDSKAVMDVSGDDIAFVDVSMVHRYSLYVDVTTGNIYANDPNPGSDGTYRFISDEFLSPKWRKKADVVVAAHKE